MSWYGTLWVHLFLDSLCFLDLCVFSFHQIRKVFSHCFSNRFSIPCSLSSFSGTHLWCKCCYASRCFKGPLNYSHFLKFLFVIAALIGCFFFLPCFPNHWCGPLLHPTFCLFLSLYSSFQILYFFISGSPFLQRVIKIYW